MHPADVRLRTIDPRREPGWRVRLQAHLLRLDPESRQMRFLAPIGDPGIAALVASAAPVALVVYEPDGEIRGCAEIHPGDGPGAAEIAVEVEGPWQGQGIGALLTAEATREAGRRGYGDIRLMCLKRNQRMVRIARRLSASALPLADWALALFRFDPGFGSGPPAGGMAAG